MELVITYYYFQFILAFVVSDIFIYLFITELIATYLGQNLPESADCPHRFNLHLHSNTATECVLPEISLQKALTDKEDQA